MSEAKNPKLTLPSYLNLFYCGAGRAPKSGRYATTANPGTGETLAEVAGRDHHQVPAAGTLPMPWAVPLQQISAKINKYVVPFKAAVLTATQPTNLEGIEKYDGSGTIPGDRAN